MNLLQKNVEINGVSRKVVVINAKPEEVNQTISKSVNCLHHIHILDRSGSMSNDINGLVENVKQTIDFMNDNDFITVIWFASHGQYQTLVKAARKDESIKILLDSIKSTLGCTCFSDPLKEVYNVIQQTSAICENFNITLFTDGEPVTPWDVLEEEIKIFEAINLYKDKVIAINTIGYGNYYNKDLLFKIAQSSEFGEMIHSSKINEYASIFNHNYEKVSDLCLLSTEINCEDKEILYINSTSCKLTKSNLKMRMLENKKNQFVILGNDSNDFDFEFNGVKYNTGDINVEFSDKTELNILYSLAYSKYYNDDRKECLDILSKDILDKQLIDTQMNAFTFDEVSNFQKLFKKCVFKPKYRFKNGKCNKNYLPAADAFCIIDLLNILIDNNAEYVYSNNYNRIGMKSEDTFNLFIWDNKLHTTKINELVFNDKELNVSIRNKITGKVLINPLQAQKVGLPNTVDAYVYRNQTLIKDGNLNMNTIQIIASDNVINVINEKAPDLIQNLESYNDKYLITLSLDSLPIINQTYASDNKLFAEYIINKIDENNDLSVKQKVVKHLMDTYNFNKGIVALDNYTPEQIEILKQHGLEKDLLYSGVNVKLAEKNEEDYYITRNLIFNIKGVATIPSVNSVLKLVNPPSSGIKKHIYDVYNEYSSKLLTFDQNDIEKFLISEKITIESKLLYNKLELNSLKIATVLTGKWIKGLEINKDNNYEYTSNDGKTLIVQANKIKKFI